MAINTPKPISREEKYLSKIGGNEEVIVPKPISREEKYMYRAAGYDDQPIPDYPISRKEKYWAKIIENGGGSGNGSTVTFDSGQKFISDNSSLKDYKIYGNGGEIHPTGVLPLTFTAKGGTAADWVIEGNNDVGENLWDEEYDGIPLTTDVAYKPIYVGEGNFTLSTTMPMTWERFTNLFVLAGSVSDGASTYNNGVWSGQNRTVTAIDGYITIAYRAADDVDPGDYQTMLVKGSTAPDHYIPYQQGVGERTKNLLEITAASTTSSGVSYDANKNDGTIIANGTAQGNSTFQWNYELAAGSYVLSGCLSQGSTSTFGLNVSLLDWSQTWWDYGSGVVINLSETTTVRVRVVIYNDVTVNNLVFKPMLRAADTDAEFIPYGYQIPLTVSQDGQPNKTYDIYIGSSPLTAGQSISKTSTGVDIELFGGENTVSTTLYNKPDMEIEASYGVGVKDNNHYIIPFKVNTTTYNIQIGDSPLYDGEYLSYKEKKLYKYIDSVLTPIDPPSPFPEISTTEGVNKVIIETSTQPNSIFITTQNPIKLVQPNIGTKTITQNGVYNASDDNLDGYSSVTVNTN